MELVDLQAAVEIPSEPNHDRQCGVSEPHRRQKDSTMLLDLDHSDFPKSKKALIASSLAIILLYRTTIANDSISVGGLSVYITVDTLKNIAIAAHMYFFIVYFSLLTTRCRQRNLDLRRERDRYAKIHSDNSIDTAQRKENFTQFSIQRASAYTMTVVDVCIPAFLSITAAYQIVWSSG